MKVHTDYNGDSVGFLKRGDEISAWLAADLTENRLGEIDAYIQWDGGIIQGKHPSDIVANDGTYETVYRRSKYEPFQYMGQCRPNSTRNMNPALSRRIYVCSRYRAQDTRTMIQNVNDALTECRRIAAEGNIPVCPHLYYTQFLEESDPAQRAFGMQAGKEDLKQCDAMTVIIRDEYISEGMEEEMLLAANELGIPVNVKHINGTEKR